MRSKVSTWPALQMCHSTGGGGLSKVMLWLMPLDCVCIFLLMILLMDSTHFRMDLPVKQSGTSLLETGGRQRLQRVPTGWPLTSQLDFAGDVLLQLAPQLRVVLKVVEVVLHPLAEHVENPVEQRRFSLTCLHLLGGGRIEILRINQSIC